ncbi:MerR family transcriptional regulator [Deinococcus aquaedulcis]|uniref:MerR family transcriptional regulator n=1 Tax=Deinococcus aquaedulcis TaxID=2840455 RepID=UPI001C83A88B|nr:MerR family transcriptional regulator [Deinococcus aquaedulcis]
MSAPFLPQSWSGNLDALVSTANTYLPHLLPLDKAGRAKDDVNARLVRHYTTERLLDEPLREGREARYTRRHLLQLLALRKLMAAGHGAAALRDTLQFRADPDLEALLTGEQLDLQPSNPALDYLKTLSAGAPARAAAPAPRDLPSPEHLTRLTLAPGLELLVRADARLPSSRLEQDQLARTLLDALDGLRRSP